jgi:hypothetical protein
LKPLRLGVHRPGPNERARVDSLPIQPLYLLGELARASGIGHRRLQRLLDTMEVPVLRAGRFLLVPLADIEEKLPSLLERFDAPSVVKGAFGPRVGGLDVAGQSRPVHRCVPKAAHE